MRKQAQRCFFTCFSYPRPMRSRLTSHLCSISHIPRERLDAFLQTVATMLRPGGKVFFVDGQREPSSTATNHQLPAQDSQVMTRKLNDGRSFEIVKNFYDPADLMMRCSRAGL